MSSNRMIVKLPLIFALLTAGCGSENTSNEQAPASQEAAQNNQNPTESNNESASQPNESNTETESTESAEHPLAALVEGTYALRAISVSEGNFPLLGRTKSSMTSYGLATIKQVGDGFTITEQACRYDMGGNETAKPSVDDAVPQSLSPVSAAIVFEGEGENVTFSREETVQLVGVRLDDPINDELPTESDDPRVFDQEGDGKPGATASVGGGVDGTELFSGDAYFVQRQRFTYTGKLEADGTLRGPLVDNSSQKIVEATNEFLLLEVTDSVAVPEESMVTLVKLNSEFDCAKISAEAESLFPAE